MTRNSHIQLSDSQRYVLSFFLENPYLTNQDIANRLGYASSSTVSYILRGNTGLSRLELFVAIGWIQPTRIDYNNLPVHVRPSYRKVLNVMRHDPAVSYADLANHLGITINTIRGYRMALYELFKISNPNNTKPNQQTNLLRLYHKLGWYRPFELPTGDES